MSSWFDGIISGNMNIVRSEMSAHDIDAKDASGLTPLMLAAKHGHKEVVHFLLDNGAASSIVDDFGHCAIIHAVMAGNSDIVRIFLDRGLVRKSSEADKQDASSLRANLARLIDGDCFDIEKYKRLLDIGLDPNVKVKISYSSQHVIPALIGSQYSYSDTDSNKKAEMCKRLDIIRLFVERGASVDGGLKSNTPLVMAIRSDYLEAVKFFVEHGASLDSKCTVFRHSKTEDFDIFHTLTKFCGNEELVTFILDRIEFPDAEDAWVSAFASENPDIFIKTLQRANCAPILSDKIWSAAIQSQYPDICVPVIGGLSDPDDWYCSAYRGRASSVSEVVAHIAAQYNIDRGRRDRYESALKWMLDHGGDKVLSVIKRNNSDAVNDLAAVGAWRSLGWLLDGGFDANHKDHRGWTPISHLSRAVLKGDVSDENAAATLEVLIRHGVDRKGISLLEKKKGEYADKHPLFVHALESHILKMSSGKKRQKTSDSGISMGL